MLKTKLCDEFGEVSAQFGEVSVELCAKLRKMAIISTLK